MALFSFKEPVLKRKIHPLNFLIFGLLSVILLGALLLWSPYTHKEAVSVSFVNALFTATSAATVTGLVVVDTADSYNFFGQLIILLLINLGGLGYMTMITFFLLNPTAAGLKFALFVKESLNLPSLGDIFQLAKKVFLTILVFELVGILLLTAFWWKEGFLQALWFGIFHTMSAFNNAGFDLMGNFQSFIPYASSFFLGSIIMGLVFLGGIGFLVISDGWAVLRKLRQNFSLHTKVVLLTSLILIVVGATSFYFLEKDGLLAQKDFATQGLISLFHSVSARTAGFATVNLGDASISTTLLLSALMFIGASPGSTGAGIKTTTFAVLVLFIISFLRNKTQPEALGRKIPLETVHRALLLFVTGIAAVFLVVFLLTLIEPFSLHQLAFEAFSAFGTAGLTTGITPALTSFSKVVLACLMFIGRITPLTLLMWLSSKKESKVQLLEEQVSIG